MTEKPKLTDRVVAAAAPVLAAVIIRLLRLTMRLAYVDFDEYRRLAAEGRQVIIAFWHGRLLMMPYGYMGRPGITILVSRSKDGELIARTVRSFGIESVRGSSSRGWFAGIKGLLRSVKNGRDVAITPDGPRGPGMEVQMGVIQLARATGLPIIPMTFGASKKKTFSSWDSFIVPYPFSRGVFICGPAVKVAGDADPEEMERARRELEETLTGITRRADSR